ncbi:hypothetical protein BYT27DRAFT_7260487 [Phlegmacium glaucopus]|nr:hypothetical protein BYT27DRAFT_7260487 [Phlegmacium glaucopus]
MCSSEFEDDTEIVLTDFYNLENTPFLNNLCAVTSAVALTLEDDVTDSVSTTLASAIASKFLASLSNITTALLNTQTFLEASTTQQASTTLNLKETTDSLTDIASKLTTLNLAAPTNCPQWPSLPSLQPSQHTVPPLSHNPASTPDITWLQQRLILTARAILVKVASDDATASQDHSPKGLQKIRDDMNINLAELDEDNFLFDSTDNSNKMKTSI